METPCVQCSDDCLVKHKVLRQNGLVEERICKKCYDNLPCCGKCGLKNLDSKMQSMYEELEVRSRNEERNHSSDPMCVECSKKQAKQCAGCACFFITPLLKTKRGDMMCPTCHESNDASYCRSPLSRDDWRQGADCCSDACSKIGSRRRFGIELEVNDCINYAEIKGLTKFGAKNDGTSGVMKEFVSPILGGDRGEEEVRKFLEEANKRKWSVTSQCGYHLHIDLSSTNESKCRCVAVGYLLSADMWGRMVHKRRRDNRYCKPQRISSLSEVKGMEFMDLINKISGSDRYYWANWHAYHSHKTLEIRLHSGTLNYTKVMNWVKMHLRFTDWCAETPITQITKALNNKNGSTILDFLLESEVFDKELADYARSRAIKFKSPFDEKDVELIKAEEFAESSVE